MVVGSAFGQAPNTGAGIANPGGTVDPDWTVTLPTNGFWTGQTMSAVMLNHTPSDFPYNAYAANTATSQWISFAADGGNSPYTTAQMAGPFTYSTLVNFGTSGTLSGHLWSDNRVLNVRVGASNFGQAPLASVYADDSVSWFQTGTGFNVAGSFSGVQTVEFTIMNGYAGYTGGNDPTAFRAQFNPVPEPFTMSLGAAAIGLAMRRRVKRPV